MLIISGEKIAIMRRQDNEARMILEKANLKKNPEIVIPKKNPALVIKKKKLSKIKRIGIKIKKIF